MRIIYILVILFSGINAVSAQSFLKDKIEIEIGVPIFSIKKYNFVDDINTGLQAGFWGEKLSVLINSNNNNYYEVGYDRYLQRTNFNPFNKGDYFFAYEVESITTIQLKKGIRNKNVSYEYGIHLSRQLYRRSDGVGFSIPDEINEDLGASFDFHYFLFSFFRLDWNNRFNVVNLNGGNAGGFFSGVTSIGISMVIK